MSTPRPFGSNKSGFTASPRINASSELTGPYNESFLHANAPVNAQATGPYDESRLFNTNSQPASAQAVPPDSVNVQNKADVQRITPDDFGQLIGIRSIGEGKSGAMILSCHQGSFFLKSDVDCKSEAAAANLFRDLPVNVPKIKVLDGSEIRLIVNALRSPHYTNVACGNLAGVLERNNECMIQELLDGSNLKSSPATIADTLCGVGGRARLFIIGMMAAYDLVIENCDRFPSVVSKHDNLGNLMLTRMGVPKKKDEVTGISVQRPTAIDQRVSDFSRDHLNSQPADKFHTDVFLKDAVNSVEVRAKLADALVSCLKARNLPVHPDALVAVRDGITEGLMKLASNNQATLKELNNRLFELTKNSENRERQKKILDDAIQLLAIKNFKINEQGTVDIM